MSGTGRPTYRPKIGKANPTKSYVPTQGVMTRDKTSHTVIKRRDEPQMGLSGSFLALSKLSRPVLDLSKAEKYAEEDADSDISLSDDSSDEDTQKMLIQELERIKKERKEEESKKYENDMKEKRKSLAEESFNAQLEAPNTSWMDDSIFHNQFSKVPAKTTEFINDSVRNQAHEDFLKKYIKI